MIINQSYNWSKISADFNIEYTVQDASMDCQAEGK